jgi:hypothetical protein
MSRWHVRIRVAPCSDHRGNSTIDYEFDTEGFRDASRRAEDILAGLRGVPEFKDSDIVKLAVLERTIVPKATLKPEQIVEVRLGDAGEDC